MDVIIIHGYSANVKSIKKSLGATLAKVNTRLGADGIKDLALHYVDYISLDDQVSLEDVAESLFLELKSRGFLSKGERQVRFIVHSTGGLVVRQLLAQYAWMNLHTLVHSIVFLAPANFGSPLAHKGKSQIGRLKTVLVDGLFSGDDYVSNWQFGEIGEQILTDLELAAPRQWELSDYDLFNPELGQLYGPDAIRGWVVAGTTGKGITSVVADTDGTDGVIVTSGAGLNVRRLSLDLVHPDSSRAPNQGWSVGVKKRDLPSVPQLIIDELDHATILTDETVAEFTIEALKIRSPAQHQTLTDRIATIEKARNLMHKDRWQQFVVRVTDDRNKPVDDYDLSFNVWNKSVLKKANINPDMGAPLFASMAAREAQVAARDAKLSQEIDKKVRGKIHPHSKQPHYRRILINIDELEQALTPDNILTVSLIAASGDKRVHYATQLVNEIVVHPKTSRQDPVLFMRDTTTQIDIKIDRYSDDGTIVKILSGAS